VRGFILERTKDLALNDGVELSPGERAYLQELIRDMEASPAFTPKLDVKRGRLLVYELQEHLYFKYAEEEADALYDAFVSEEPEDYRSVYVTLDEPEA
jgi:hypothetical protein